MGTERPDSVFQIRKKLMTDRFSVFETPLGWAGIAWTSNGVVGVELPAAEAGRVGARLLRRFPGAGEGAPSDPEIREVVESITAVLGGEARDLSAIQLDARGVPAFDQQVYAMTRTIPFGQTRSYGQIATSLGDARL